MIKCGDYCQIRCDQCGHGQRLSVKDPISSDQEPEGARFCSVHRKLVDKAGKCEEFYCINMALGRRR